MISNRGYQRYRGFPTTPQPHRRIYGSGTGSTRHGYGAGKPDPRVTHSKPYVDLHMLGINAQLPCTDAAAPKSVYFESIHQYAE